MNLFPKIRYKCQFLFLLVLIFVPASSHADFITANQCVNVWVVDHTEQMCASGLHDAYWFWTYCYQYPPSGGCGNAPDPIVFDNHTFHKENEINFNELDMSATYAIYFTDYSETPVTDSCPEIVCSEGKTKINCQCVCESACNCPCRRAAYPDCSCDCSTSTADLTLDSLTYNCAEKTLALSFFLDGSQGSSEFDYVVYDFLYIKVNGDWQLTDSSFLFEDWTLTGVEPGEHKLVIQIYSSCNELLVNYSHEFTLNACPACGATFDFTELNDFWDTLKLKFPFSTIVWSQDVLDQLQNLSAGDFNIYLPVFGDIAIPALDLSYIRMLIYLGLVFAVTRHIIRKIL